MVSFSLSSIWLKDISSEGISTFPFRKLLREGLYFPCSKSQFFNDVFSIAAHKDVDLLLIFRNCSLHHAVVVVSDLPDYLRLDVVYAPFEQSEIFFQLQEAGLIIEQKIVLLMTPSFADGV